MLDEIEYEATTLCEYFAGGYSPTADAADAGLTVR
jgi:hypothetical protein